MVRPEDRKFRPITAIFQVYVHVLHVCSTASHHRMHYQTRVPYIHRHTYCYGKLNPGSKGSGFNLETIKNPIWGGLALFYKGLTRMLLFFLKEGYLWPMFRSGRTRWDWAWPSRPTPTTTALWSVPPLLFRFLTSQKLSNVLMEPTVFYFSRKLGIIVNRHVQPKGPRNLLTARYTVRLSMICGWETNPACFLILDSGSLGNWGAQTHNTDTGWSSLNVCLMGKEQQLVDAGG